MLDTFPPEAKEEIEALKELVFFYKKKFLTSDEERFTLQQKLRALEVREAGRSTQDVIRSL